MTKGSVPKASYKLAKIALGGAVLVGLGMATMAYAQQCILNRVQSYAFLLCYANGCEKKIKISFFICYTT